MKHHMRLTLSGRNNGMVERAVTLHIEGWDDQEIGSVKPCYGAWEALDMKGLSHGNIWLTDWYAAEALLRGLIAKLGVTMR